MPLTLIACFGNVLTSALAHPVHYKIVVAPIVEDTRKMLFKSMPIHPRFRRRPPYRITDKPYWHISCFLKFFAKIVAYCRKLSRRLRAAHLPLRRSEILQVIDTIKSRRLPRHSISTPARFHITKANSRIRSLRNVSTPRRSLTKSKFHIRLPRAKPYIARYDILKHLLLLSRLNA